MREWSAKTGRGLSELRHLLTGHGAVYFVAVLIGKVGGFVLIPLYARNLSLVEYGDYGLAQTVVIAAAPLLSLGVPVAVTRFYFEGEDRAAGSMRSGSVARTLTVFASLLALLVIALTYVIAPVGVGMMTRRTLIDLTVASFGGSLTPIPLAYFRAQNRPFSAVAIQTFDLLALAAFGIYFVAIERRGLPGALDAMAATGLVSGCVAIAYIWIRMRGTLSPSIFFQAIRFSYPVLVQAYALWLLSAADRWTLKLTHHDQALGSYSLASQLANPASLPAGAWNEAEHSRIGELVQREGVHAITSDLPAARRKFFWLALAPALGLVALLPILPFIVGHRAAVPWWMVAAFGCIVIVDAQMYPYQNALLYSSKTRALNQCTVLSIIINGLALILFVPRGGAIGALAAKLVTSVGRNLFVARVVRRSIRDA